VRIAIDLDGTICPLKEPHQSYADLEPLPGAVARLAEFRAVGHHIVIITARNMATCESNVGQVLKNIGKLTFDWLEQWNIEYDEIYFGKPNAEVYIDDRAIRFQTWKEISEELLQQQARSR
jgi:capsule biosynthesis phosphatase